jgi:hypothetical protein
MSFQLYGDTGLHDNENQSNNMFGLLANTGTADYCIWSLCGAMGWQSIVATTKDAAGGQGKSCEYPYYDSEVIFYHTRNCNQNETMNQNCGPLGSKLPPYQLDDKGISMYQGEGIDITCTNQVTLDIGKNIDRYLMDNFIPGVEDRSTDTDTNINNKNYKLYGVTSINRTLFSLSESSTDIPAQISRTYYNPKESVNYCNICPADVDRINIDLGENTNKDWVNITNNYKGNPAFNSNEFDGWIETNIWKNWKNNKTHSDYGCYTVES